MPPKNKFTRDEIIQAALGIVREAGLAGLTARSLAERLQSSPKVIFGQFENMEDLSHSVVRAAEFVLVQYIRSALERAKPFRAVGMAYILFASQEPQLFKILYLNPHKHPIESFKDFLPQKAHSYQQILESIVEDYPMSIESAEFVYQHLFIYSHGLASMIASGIYSFSQEEMTERLTQVFAALLKEMKGNKND